MYNIDKIRNRKYRIVLIYKLLGDVNLHKVNDKKYFIKITCRIKKITIFASSGEMAEWSIAAVLKTVEP